MEGELTKSERELLATFDGTWRQIKKAQVGTAQSLRKRGLVESRHVFSSSLGWRIVQHKARDND